MGRGKRKRKSASLRFKARKINKRNVSWELLLARVLTPLLVLVCTLLASTSSYA